MANSDQKELFDVLDQQHVQQKKVDRVLYFVLPIVAFLICVICANLNWQSTLGTFLVLWIAFYAVGIKRTNLKLWLLFVTIYSLVDIYFSYHGTIPLQAVGRHAGTMMTLVGIVGISRPYIDRWFMKK